MNSLFFDAGPIISLATNNLLWFLADLKKHFHGEFYITKAVKTELIDKPIRSKKFKFEAMQIAELIAKGVLKIYDQDIHDEAVRLLDAANSVCYARRRPLRLVQLAEIETALAAAKTKAEAVVIDERTMRVMLEKPNNLAKITSRKMRCTVNLNNANLQRFRKMLPKLNVIRSVELVTIGYELGLFNRYLSAGSKKLIENADEELLKALLWGVKLNGSSVSQQEIDNIITHEFSSRKKKVL